MNIIARPEYKLVYYDSTVRRFNHYTTRTPPPNHRMRKMSYNMKGIKRDQVFLKIRLIRNRNKNLLKYFCCVPNYNLSIVEKFFVDLLVWGRMVIRCLSFFFLRVKLPCWRSGKDVVVFWVCRFLAESGRKVLKLGGWLCELPSIFSSLSTSNIYCCGISLTCWPYILMLLLSHCTWLTALPGYVTVCTYMAPAWIQLN